MIAWTKPLNKGNIFTFNFRNRINSNLTSIDAAQYTIDYITKNYPAPYTLYLSGGVDSQAMLYAWHQSKVPYNTFSAIYNDQEFNRHDIKYLDQFAGQYGININYHKFDVLNFLETEHDTYANLYTCGSPQITTFMKLTELTPEGTVIMSGSFIRGKEKGNGTPDPNNWGLYHYYLKKRKNFVAWFFLETQELAHSFNVDINIIKSLKKTQKVQEDQHDQYEEKVLIYQYHGFPVIPQEKKLNGFEMLKEYYDTNSPREPSFYERMSRIPKQKSHRNFDLLYRNKYEAKFSNYKYMISC